MKKLKLISLLLSGVAISLLLSCSGNQSKIDKLKKLQEESAEINVKGSDALSRGDNNALAGIIKESSEIKEEIKKMEEEIKNSKDLTSEQKKEAEKLGVEFN